jgi:WD40 repeat protein
MECKVLGFGIGALRRIDESSELTGPDPRSDLFSLGVLLSEILAGQAVPAPLARLVGRLREPDSDRRPRSAREVLAELAAVEEEMRRSVPCDLRQPGSAVRGRYRLLGEPLCDGEVTAGRTRGRSEPGAVGSVVAGRFRIERRIGGGGLGQVFAVTDLDAGGRWALKLLCRERLGTVTADRVLRAVEPLTRLRHPGVVALREAGEAEDGSPFLLFEPVEGPDLQELTFPVSLDAVCTVARDIAEALGAIHRHGGIHGDLKPRHARLACAQDGRRWRLLDTGLAAALAGLIPGVVPGILAGTPGYLAPERTDRSQRSARDNLDPRSDLYSLGVILHELICGRLPGGGRPEGLVPRGGAHLPERLQLLVLRLIEPDPRWRPASAREVVDELAAVEAGLCAEEIGEATAVLRSPLLKTAVLASRTGRLLAARALQRQKTDGQAEECYRAALLGDPQNPFLHAFLGRSLGRQEKWSEAAEAYRRALHLDPGLGPAWGRLHEALRFLGDEAGARAVRAKGHAAWWSLADPVRRRIEGDAVKLAAVAFSPDGRRLASAGVDGALRLWNVGTGKAEQVLRSGHGPGGIQALAFSPRAPLVASAGRDGTVCLWSLSAGALAACLIAADAVRAVAFSRDGKSVAGGGAGGAVRVWGSADHRLRSVHLFGSPINAVAFSPDGTLLAGSADGTLEIVSLADPERRLTLRAHGEPVTTVAFSADGGLVASGSVDRTVKLWDAATGDHVTTLRGHDGAVSALAFLPGGHLLASSGFDATVRLWDLFEGKLRDTFTTEAGFLTSLAISPDGSTLAAGTDLPRIELWGSPLP